MWTGASPASHGSSMRATAITGAHSKQVYFYINGHQLDVWGRLFGGGCLGAFFWFSGWNQVCLIVLQFLQIEINSPRILILVLGCLICSDFSWDVQGCAVHVQLSPDRARKDQQGVTVGCHEGVKCAQPTYGTLHPGGVDPRCEPRRYWAGHLHECRADGPFSEAWAAGVDNICRCG